MSTELSLMQTLTTTGQAVDSDYSGSFLSMKGKPEPIDTQTQLEDDR